MPGRLAGIASKARKGAPIIPVDRATVTTETGVSGDSRGMLRKRQVTVLFAEDWAATMAELDADAPWTVRRATLLVTGMKNPRRAGDVLAIGSVRLKVTGETEPCQRMEDQLPGLWDAMRRDWRGGVTARVLEGGEIAVGDAVTWEAGD